MPRPAWGPCSYTASISLAQGRSRTLCSPAPQPQAQLGATVQLRQACIWLSHGKGEEQGPGVQLREQL